MTDSKSAPDMNEDSETDTFGSTAALTLLTANQKDLEALAAVFKNLDLPTPGPESFYLSYDRGTVICIEEYGVVLRITPLGRKDGNIKNVPHFIRPLFSTVAGNYHVDLYPGLKTPVTYEEAKEINKRIKESYGVGIDDDHSGNFAFIPGTKYPVVIDIDSTKVFYADKGLSLLKQGVAYARRLLNAGKELDFSKKDLQRLTYYPLRGIMQAAWPECEENANPELIDVFWQACKGMKEHGQLASWLEKGQYGACNSMFNQVNAYTQRLNDYKARNAVKMAV